MTLGMAVGVAMFAPAAAQAGGVPAVNVGAGAAEGSVTFDAGKGIPPLFSPAAPTSFTLDGSAPAFTFNTVISGFSGVVQLHGTGSSTSENAGGGSGTLTLTTVHGDGTTGGKLDCAGPTSGTLTGGYTRVGTDVVAVLGGSCTVNGWTSGATFIFRGQFVPSNPNSGSPIMAATFVGGFVISPI